MITSNTILFDAIDTLTHNAITDALERPGQFVRVEVAEINDEMYAEIESIDTPDVSNPRAGKAIFSKDRFERSYDALKPMAALAA